MCNSTSIERRILSCANLQIPVWDADDDPLPIQTCWCEQLHPRNSWHFASAPRRQMSNVCSAELRALRRRERKRDRPAAQMQRCRGKASTATASRSPARQVASQFTLLLWTHNPAREVWTDPTAELHGHRHLLQAATVIFCLMVVCSVLSYNLILFIAWACSRLRGCLVNRSPSVSMMAKSGLELRTTEECSVHGRTALLSAVWH